MRVARFAIVVALGVTAAGASPRADNGAALPTWLLGRWCPIDANGQFVAPRSTLMSMGDPSCLIWRVEGPSRLVGRQSYAAGSSGINDRNNDLQVDLAGGRLRLRDIAWGIGWRGASRWRESSRDANEVAFTRGGRARFRIARDGDVLTIDYGSTADDWRPRTFRRPL